MIDDFRLKIEGMLSIRIKKTERSLRLVGVAAPTPRRAIPQIVIRHSSFVIPTSSLYIFFEQVFHLCDFIRAFGILSGNRSFFETFENHFF